ncbi:MAG TPA: molecular chaperone TorD family protein [Gammaproteobacteria bacterium]|nr:molecular chaperone TorD family protein [Gammaproteobacteria bacterium]
MKAAAELVRGLAVLSERPRREDSPIATALELPVPESLEAWQAAHTATFLQQCPPYASIYLGEAGALGGPVRDRVAGLWRALGLRAPGEPDHLATLLALYAGVLEQAGADDRWQHLRRVVLWEHLLPWLPPFLERVEAVGEGPYPEWSRMLQRLLRAEAEATGIPPELPLHLRALEAPSPGGWDGDVDAVLGPLLAPARSGVILPPADLRRLARDTGLGMRMGDRRLMLRSLLEQDATAVSGWIAGAALCRCERLRVEERWLGAVARHWRDRAAATACWLAPGEVPDAMAENG